MNMWGEEVWESGGSEGGSKRVVLKFGDNGLGLVFMLVVGGFSRGGV